MRKIAENALKLLKKSEGEAARRLLASDDAAQIQPESIHKLGEVLVMVLRGDPDFLLIVADYRQKLPSGFQGEFMELSDGGAALTAPFVPENAVALRRCFPWCAPSVPPGKRPAAEVGAPLNVNLTAAGKKRLFPIVEQSMCDEAVFASFAGDCREGFGIRAAVQSADEAARAQDAGATLLVLRGMAEPAESGEETVEYAGRTFVLEDGAALTVSGAEASAIRSRYQKTVAVATEVFRRSRVALTLSLAGSGSATTAAELLFLSRELLKNNVALWGIEPEWAGEADDKTIRLFWAVVRSYGRCRLVGGSRVAAVARELGEAYCLRADG